MRFIGWERRASSGRQTGWNSSQGRSSTCHRSESCTRPSLHGWLHASARGLGGAAVVWCQNPLRLDDINEPEPDIAVLRPRADFYTTAHPGPADVLLVIEVADTSLAYDLGTKVPLYARHGIPEVWVIDAATRRARVFRQPAGGREGGHATDSGYATEMSVEPHEPLASAGVVDEAGGLVVVEWARLLPMVG